MMSHFNTSPVIYNVEEVKKLVQEAKQGNHTSFTKLYNAFFTPVYRYVFSRLHDKDKTDDIVQMVFIKWYNALPSYTVHVSPLQYLFVIARRLLIDTHEVVHITSLDDDETIHISLADERALQDEVLDIKITSEQVLKYFEALSPLHQEVLRLHFFAELSTGEIATLLEKKESAIRQLKHRALESLRVLTQGINDNT